MLKARANIKAAGQKQDLPAIVRLSAIIQSGLEHLVNLALHPDLPNAEQDDIEMITRSMIEIIKAKLDGERWYEYAAAKSAGSQPDRSITADITVAEVTKRIEDLHIQPITDCIQRIKFVV